METILTDEMASLITNLSENNFNILIKNYNKQYYDTKEVNLCNGPYDGGIDLVIFKDGEEIKKIFK